MNELHLFAGAGGGILGGQLLGHTCVCAVEINPYCQRVLLQRQRDGMLPRFPIYGDIKDFPPRTWVYCLDGFVKYWYKPRNSWEQYMAGKLKKLTPEQAEECVRLYERGLSLAPIAQYFGVSRNAMWDLLRRRTAMRSNKRYADENHFFRGGSIANDAAQNLLEKAIQRGIIERSSCCEICGDSGKFKDGRSKIQGHHSDYNKPLEVLWLCQKCHHIWHKNNKPIAKEEMMETPQIDVICGGFP